jgi:5S rRNA maturation endonuclease (ribonuclease M5)
LSTHLKEKEERIQHILQCLATESDKGTPIIVEGKKDIETLRTLAIGGKIIAAKSGKSLLDLVSEVEEERPKEVVLLLDFDRRGKELTRLLKQHLETAKIVPNTSFWSELFSILGKDVKDVESLSAYLETLRRKYTVHQRTLSSQRRAQARKTLIYQRKTRDKDQ